MLNNLNPMKKQSNKVDDFFREALQNHAVVPSEAAKAAFLKEAATFEKSGKQNKHWYLWLSAVILLVSISAGLYTFRPVQTVKTTSSPIVHSIPVIKTKTPDKTQSSETKSTSKSETVTNILQKINNNHRQVREKKSVSQPDAAPVTRNEFPLKNPTSSTLEKPISQDPPSGLQEKQPVPEPVSYVNAQSLATKETTPDSLKNTITAKTDLLSKETNFSGSPKPGSDANPKKWNLDLGAYYWPEWMFNTLEGEKYVNNFGIEGIFHFGRYSLRTGAGLSITKGTHELSINYNDYLGNFNELDSVSFVWDASHTHLIPTYYFTTTSVWDSLMKTQYAKIIKRYTYLQIPLILGYDFWKNDHFSIGLRVGPILSVLLRTEQVSDNYDPGKDRIIQINLITPERIQTYWQFIGGINAAFSLSRNIGVEVEPDLRYYFNSVYEKPVNNRKPWSAGIRIAFLFKK